MSRANRLSNMLVSVKPGEERFGFAVALCGHVLLLALLMLKISALEAKPPALSPALAVDIVDGSDVPMFGDPNGDDAPPPSVEPQPQTEEPVEEQQVAEPEPVAPTEELPEEPVEQEPEPTQAPQQSSAPARPETATPSDRVGSGRIAFGAQTHGLGGGMDGDLAAAIAQAVATQISACWDGPRDNAPDDLIITMIVDFDHMGQLVGNPRITRIVNEQEFVVEQPEGFELAAVQAAQRCNPIRLPPHLYRYWRQVHVQIFSNMLPEQSAQQQLQTAAGRPSVTGS